MLQLLKNTKWSRKMNGNIWSCQGTNRENGNCSLLTLLATPKRNTLDSFKSNATNIKIKGKLLKYYVLEMSV